LRVINKNFAQEKAAMMAKEHFGHRAMCGRECLTSFGMKRFTVYGIFMNFTAIAFLAATFASFSIFR
jgi:hypothetical protein